MTTLTSSEQIFNEGNKHLETKLRYFSKPQATIVKYIINRLRKYKGEFFESHSTIAHNLEVSVSTIKRCVKKMQELQIIVVANRTEDGRKTTNVIRLLAYKPFELVKEIVETVKEVVSKVVEKVSNKSSKKDACETRSDATKTRQARSNYNRKPIRTEIQPEWLNVEYVQPEETDEVKRMREILMNGGVL